jgi:hypothetical protein
MQAHKGDGTLERTITNEDLDPASASVWQEFRERSGDIEPDLAVDGLSESLFVRLFRSLTGRRRP